MSRIVDLMKGLISLALIAALLVGVPALLLAIVGFPLPTEAPSWQLIRNHIEDGAIPDIFVVKALALVVWIVWIQLAVAVLTEVFALMRGRAAGRAPVLPGIQLFAGKLVASTVLIVSALTPSRAAVAAPIVPLDPMPATAEAAPQAQVDAAAGFAAIRVSGDVGLTASAASGFASVVDQQHLQASADGQYVTSSGDSWWDMAERLLGDGMRWSELRDLNQGRTMLTGEIIDEHTESVRGGWQLDVPTDADSRLLSPRPGQPAAESAGGDEPAEETEIEGGGELESDDESVASETSGLLRAIRPATLVYEGPTGAPDAGPGVPYQVVEGDNLWDIAERHLADPFRWPEIFENSNQLQQSFGRTITDPNLIWPDSILWLPGDATGVPAADAELVGEVLGPLTPAPGDQPPTEVRPEDLQRLADAAGSSSAGAAPPDPVTDPDPGSGRPWPDQGHDSTVRAVENTNVDLEQHNDFAGRLAGPAGLAFGAGGVLLASGLLGLLERARRVRLSEAGERSLPGPPPMELTDIETVLRNSSDHQKARSIHGAIRSLADRPVVVSEPLAAPEIIRVSSDRIEVVQRGADPDLPAPWLQAQNPALDFLADRSLAVLPAEFFPDVAEDAHLGSPATTCVTVGGGLMVNLEAVGVLGIDGPAELAAGLVRSMVHELATGPARRSVDLLVSDWLPGADLHQHVRCGPLDNAVGRLASWLEDVELGLTAADAFSAYALRAGGMSDSIPNATVIFADTADAEAIAPLVERAARTAMPLAVVFTGDFDRLATEPETMIRLDAETLRLEPHGFTAAMQYLDVDLVLGAESLIAHARRAPMVLRADVASANPMADLDTDPAQVPTEETPEHEIATELPAEEHEVTDQAEDGDSGMLIRVLGPVVIEGGPADLDGAEFDDAEQSVLSFLALVGPSTEEQIRQAVWPGGGIDDAGFHRAIARIGDRLGQRLWDGGDRYRLRSVITDLGSARRWITQSQAMSADRARNLLQLALADVRGRPFSGVNERYWQWTADHRMALATQATSLLMDACFDLCDSAYEANDIYLAKWACEVGSLVDPLHETVITRRVQLLLVLGQRAEAEQVVDQWEWRYREAAGRPAPRGVRLALADVEAMAPHAG